jgi:Ca2+-binding RTX toxin-like protein
MFIVGESTIFDFNTFETVTRVSLWKDIDGIITSPADQTGADYEQIILQTPQGDFEGEGLSVTTLEDGSWLASGTSENGAWIYQEGDEGPRYLADILADEGADLDWDPQAVERVRYDSESGWLHMAVSGSSYYVGLQLAEPVVDDGPTHIGTARNDNLRVDITGLTRVVIDTMEGNDLITIVGTPEPGLVVEVYAGAGNDRVRFNADVEGLVFLGAGNDDFSVAGRVSSDMTVNAESGRNSIRTGSGNDTITTGSGRDTIRSGAGNDTIDAGSGRNYVWAGAGDDVVLGGEDADLVWAGNGDDVVDAGGGNDYAWGGNGADILLGRSGNDRFWGGNGDDSIFGGSGRDTLFGQNGNDILSGGDDRDILFAGAGSDLLYTGGDRDIAFAGRNDRIVRDEDDRFWWSSYFATEIDEEEFIDGLDGAFGRLEDLGLDNPLF